METIKDGAYKMTTRDKLIDIISGVNNEEHYIPISVAVRLADAIIAAGPIVSEETLAKLRKHYSELLGARIVWANSNDVEKKKRWLLLISERIHELEETLSMLGLLDAVKEQEQQ